MSKRLLIIITLLCVIVSLTACGQTAETPSIPPPEDMSGIPGDVLLPDASDAPAIEPEPSEPETNETTTPPETDSAPTSNPANSTAGTTSRAATPPASSVPSQAPAQQPTTSTPTPSTSIAPPPAQPSKPTYTEADYQRIIDTIRTYGEEKGFVWNNSFAFGQAGLGYYGRPNLERDGYDGVVNMLKYNCDTIFDNGGICYFKVVKHIYQNQTEFVVLYG